MQPPGFPPVHPIDGGYSWLICLGAFGMQFFVQAGMKTTGIMFIEVLEVFKADKGLTALTIGLMAFGYAVCSPIANTVGMMSTMRRSCYIGAVFAFNGLMLTCMAPSVLFVIVALGLLSGIGYGFMVGPSLVMVGQYFSKRRALATGMALAGGSIGTLTIPLFLNFAIDKYGFRGAILIYSGLALHTIPAAMLMRPVMFYEPKRRLLAIKAMTMAPSESADADIPSVNHDDDDDNELNAPPSPAASAPEEPAKSFLRNPEGRVDRQTRYQLVGSRLVVIPEGQPDSPESEPLAKPAPAAAPASGPAGAQPGPPGGGPPAMKITPKLALRMFLQKLCDRDLLHSYAFIVFSIGLSLGQGGYVNNCLFLPPFALEMWKSKKIAMILITVLGLFDLVGRIGGGWFADLGLVRKPFIVGFSFLVVGVSTVALTIFGPYSMAVSFIYVILLGAFGGTYSAMLAVIIAEMFGLAKLPAGIGLSSLIMGLAILPLPPFLGKTQEASGTYAMPLRIAGVLLIIAGLLYYLIPMLHAKDQKRAAERAAATSQATEPAKQNA